MGQWRHGDRSWSLWVLHVLVVTCEASTSLRRIGFCAAFFPDVFIATLFSAPADIQQIPTESDPPRRSTDSGGLTDAFRAVL
mmetsp:Transcript_8235/g.22810  ORF Transcript_8235/g.22810 Transcript_8235/m.22810 type:complete len:82 (-) Transcript_8235:135-380(-)